MECSPSVGQKVNAPQRTLCATLPKALSSNILLWSLLFAHYTNFMQSSVRVSLSLHPLNVHVHNLVFLLLLWDCTVAGQISLLPVFSCDARISTWKGQDQGQSLAVCLWTGKTRTVHPWNALISRNCPNQHLSDFLVQVSHLGILLKRRIWFNEFEVGSEVLHLQRAPRCCWPASPRTMFWVQSIRAQSWEGGWGNISAQWESMPWFISNVCHEEEQAGNICHLCPTNLFVENDSRQEREYVIHTIECYTSMKMALYILDGLNSKI